MTDDWLKSLQSLRDTLPEGEDFPVTPDAPEAAPKQPRLDIVLDKKGRKGKVATIIAGFTVSDDEVAEIARTLRQRLGTGGSSRGGEILIQGDKRQQVQQALTSMGLKCRII